MRKKIGIIVNYLYESYQLKVLNGIFNTAKRLNTDIFVFVGGNLYQEDIENKQRNKIYKLISEENIHGLIIMGLVLGYNISKSKVLAFYNQYINQIPIVSLGLYVEKVPSVVVDNLKGFKDLLIHLIKDHKYRNIAFVTGPKNNEDAQKRYELFMEITKKHGISISPEFIYEGDFAKLSGIEAVKTFLDKRKIKPQVIVFSNDMMAIGGIEELKRRNIKVPEEIAVTGFDNIEESYFVNPTLTTVEQPLSELGEKSLELCLSLIEGENFIKHVFLPTKLIIRESCGHRDLLINKYHIDKLDKSFIKGKIKNLDEAKKYKDNFIKIIRQDMNIEKRPLDKLTSDLYDSFFSSIFKKRSSFLNTIKTYALKIEDLENLKEFLSALYYFIELFLSKKFLLKAENIILKAISTLDMYSEKNLRYDKFKTNEETEQLGFIGSDLISSFKMEEIIERMAQRIPELNIKKFYIVLYEEESNIGNLKLAYIDGRILSEDYYFKISEIIPSRLYPKKNSILIVKPLFFQEKWFGHIVFEYGPKRGIIYEILRAQISAAIQGALLFEEINKLVITDPLTGLFNRRYIEEEIQKEIARSQRYERPLSVMVLDLDNFKLVNDTFGHKYGDEILKKIGETLKKSCRKVDVVGRYGGDEFVVILPETNLEKSIRVADKIIKNVEKIDIATTNNLKLYLSVSIGIASFPEITRNPEKLLNLADLAMYKAKRLGGRQYSIASY